MLHFIECQGGLNESTLRCARSSQGLGLPLAAAPDGGLEYMPRDNHAAHECNDIVRGQYGVDSGSQTEVLPHNDSLVFLAQKDKT